MPVYEQLLEMLPTQGWVFDPGAAASPALAGGSIFLTDDHLATTVIKPGKAFQQERLNYIWSSDHIVSSPVFQGGNVYLRGGMTTFTRSARSAPSLFSPKGWSLIAGGNAPGKDRPHPPTLKGLW